MCNVSIKMPIYGTYPSIATILSMQAANALLRLHIYTGSSMSSLPACIISDKLHFLDHLTNQKKDISIANATSVLRTKNQISV